MTLLQINLMGPYFVGLVRVKIVLKKNTCRFHNLNVLTQYVNKGRTKIYVITTGRFFKTERGEIYFKMDRKIFYNNFRYSKII
jgi:hypothetical protein